MIDNLDIIGEIIEYLPVKELLYFARTCKIYSTLVKQFLNRIDEDQFIKKFKILNKTFEAYIKLEPIDFSTFKLSLWDDHGILYYTKYNDQGRHEFAKKYKNKHEYYTYNNKDSYLTKFNMFILIKIYQYQDITRIRITGCKTIQEVKQRVDDMLFLLYNKKYQYRLRHISTTLRINNIKDNERLNIICCSCYGTGKHDMSINDKLLIKGIKYLVHGDKQKKVDVTYNNFITFYLTYKHFIE